MDVDGICLTKLDISLTVRDELIIY